MKILHLPLWVPNENDIQLGNFIQEHISLSSKRNEIHSIEFFADPNLHQVKIESNSGVTRISYPKSKFRALNLLRYIKASRLAINELTKIGFFPDLIHCHVAGRNLWMAHKYFSNKPIVLSEHWSGYVNGNFERQSYLMKKFILSLINKCNVVTSVSDHLKEGMIRQGVSKEIVILQNAIKYKEKTAIKETEQMTFLIVADLVDEIKNISGVLEAIKQLKLEHPHFKLIIVGDGPDSPILKEKTNVLDLETQLSFVCRLAQQKVQDYLLKADCLIVNSNYETFSMVTIEAILTGVPVIASRCGGPEQFVNAKNGLLIPKRDKKSLVNAMKEMYQNRSQYKPNVVRNSVKENYSLDRVEDQLNEIYIGSNK